MKCQILHESRGRMRVHLVCAHMTLHQADVLEYYLKNIAGVLDVKVFDRTCDAVVSFQENRTAVLRAFAAFSFQKAEAMDLVPAHTPRALNREYEDKLAMTVLRRTFSKLFLPLPVRAVISAFRSVKYIREGLKALLCGKLSVAVLDATAVTVSMVRGDFDTAGSVMFMLRLGEILEEWTHKKSVADLAGAMALNVDQVWVKAGETEVLVPVSSVQAGDLVVVRTGNLIALDGKVVEGEAFEYFMEFLCKAQNVDLRTCLANSFCLSADVCAAFDPGFSEVFERKNAAYLNYGVGLCKYTGSGGKSGASDASSEVVGKIRKLLNDHEIAWQMCELGKTDAGGGGTVAKYMAKRNIDTLDAGVPVLSMHAPFEVVAKYDCYMTYRAVKAIFEEN